MNNSRRHLLHTRRRQWHPTPVLLPGQSYGWRSLVGCSPWGCWVRHDWATSLSLFTLMHWRRKWQPTPVFLPGESQGPGSLVGCRLWGRTESDTTEWLKLNWTVTLNGLPWKRTEFILSLMWLHPSTAFWTLVDYEGYSISSKGLFPTVVDIMVIWIKFARSHPF